MVDSFGFEILIPMANKVFGQIICLVDHQNKLFVSLTLFDVRFEIFRIEKIWISGVDDLE